MNLRDTPNYSIWDRSHFHPVDLIVRELLDSSLLAELSIYTFIFSEGYYKPWDILQLFH